jgi:23S rRNA (cytosine1962-C5)-methyltransferase
MNFYIISKIFATSDYELLDSGEGEKLERYASVVVSRPDPQALWEKKLPKHEWEKAQAIFSRDSKNTGWKFKGKISERWQIEFGGLKFWIKPTSFKHTGIFPEQLANWEWMQKIIHDCHSERSVAKSKNPLEYNVQAIPPRLTESSGRALAATLGRNDKVRRPVHILNLFGYTGGATLAVAAAGTEVCHVDGSKVAINWAKENAEISGLKNKPIRWILDDAVKFVKREIKRGRKYDGIIMDPPAFGHGPTGEMWKIEEDFLPFLKLCFEILSDKPLFFLINGYASGYSAIAYKNNLEYLVEKFGGNIEMGELTIEESKSQRLLPAGIFARWYLKT